VLLTRLAWQDIGKICKEIAIAGLSGAIEGRRCTEGNKVDGSPHMWSPYVGIGWHWIAGVSSTGYKEVNLYNVRGKSQYIKMQRPHTCRNCGIMGHLYKDCPHPTMSFGLICYRKRSRGAPIEYLMIQRKDSLSFMEFVRGKYQLCQVDYIKRLLGAMTQDERHMLLTKPFEDLWNHVWYQPCIPRHTTEFLEARKKYEKLRDGFLLEKTWINLTELTRQAPSPYSEPEWGFPKGRRRLKEDDMDCAVREFCEETGMVSSELTLMKEIPPFEEIFFGTNNVLYRHVYYVASTTLDRLLPWTRTI